MLLLAFEVGLREISAALIGAIGAGGAAIGVYDKRRRELTETYKGLYEAKTELVSQLETKVARLEARIDFFESDYMRKFTEGIVEAVFRYLEESGRNRHDH